MPRVRDRRRLLGAAALLLVVVLGAGGGAGARDARGVDTGAAAWRGFVDGGRSNVAVGQRAIVVLRYASLADRVAAAGGRATEAQMRRWTAAALAAQKQVAARLSREGVRIVPDFVYTRTLNGFAAALDARALALLERDEDVVGVYPVRVAYPAATALAAEAYGPEGGRRSLVRVPGFDGAGVTVALLDTGVDATHPYIRGRVHEGVDVLDPDGDPTPRHHPQEPGLLEQHGTQMAGLLVGRNGPTRLHGVAPGAAVLPIRVAGWQPDAEGGFTVYARTDQLLAGLEHAVDPDGDGSTLDAARVAVVGVVEPFASFPDGPLARAAQGALDLDTLVVAPAGNDGPAGPGYGSIGGPGGAPAALTVGAADARVQHASARVVLRAGLRTLLDRVVPLAAATLPEGTTSLRLVRPGEAPARPAGSPLARFFDADGYSVVAGRAALLARTAVPAGALGLDDGVAAPVIGVPADVARAARQALSRGVDVRVALGAVAWRDNDGRSRNAPFSSHGLSFGGGVKPELAAPGIELLTASAGRNSDRRPRYGTISGSSAAAAVAGGAAALLAQARPGLDGAALKSVLVGTASPLSATKVSAQGAGLLDPAAALVAEVATSPAAVAFGAATEPGWASQQRLVIRNVTNRRIAVRVEAEVEGIAGVSVVTDTDRLVLRAGERRAVTLTATVSFLPRGLGAITGDIRLVSTGAVDLVVPWAVALPVQGAALLGEVALSEKSFRASDAAPAVLTVRAGGVASRGGLRQLQPVERLDVELWRGRERLGLLARLRDVLPGSYAFGITGRGPRGGTLPRGPYRLRVLAVPPAGEQQAKSVAFRIR